VWPEYREYERAVTTLVDAFVKPHMRQYLGDISEQLPPSLRQMPFLVMQSSGGVLSSEQVADKPIATALSGPAAGVVGASAMARLAGRIATNRMEQIQIANAERQVLPEPEVRAASIREIPAGRFGTAEEFADVAAFLVSVPASYITGSSIRVDGGAIKGI
jgi:hypothetical protein